MSELLDPKDFIITRKRKKYRFAKFHNAPNCFELDEWQPRPIDIVEVGAGTALFSVELAARHPERMFLALDVKADRLQKGAYEAINRGIENIYFVRARADQLDQLLAVHSLSIIWLTFPDPFPKRRSAGRRLTHPTFLKRYAALLKADGALRLKHDNLTFFCWSLEQLVSTGWNIRELRFDLHEAWTESDEAILTSYERRWLDEGRTSHYLMAVPPQLHKKVKN